jgi:hypothetical protein
MSSRGGPAARADITFYPNSGLVLRPKAVGGPIHPPHDFIFNDLLGGEREPVTGRAGVEAAAKLMAQRIGRAEPNGHCDLLDG